MERCSMCSAREGKRHLPGCYKSNDSQNDTATAEQIAALVSFAARHGRTWKSKLSAMWLNGRDSYEPEGSVLRSVRNGLGPTWLFDRCKLPR